MALAHLGVCLLTLDFKWSQHSGVLSAPIPVAHNLVDPQEYLRDGQKKEEVGFFHPSGS